MKYAAYAATRNLYEDLETSLKSLLINSDVDIVYLLIEDDEFPMYLPKECKIINVANQEFFKPDCPNITKRWTYMSLMRMVIYKLLPKKVDKVLVLDCDTIVDKNINEIWDIDLGDNYFAGCKEPAKSQYKPYYNAGVLIQNLKLLRSSGMGDKIVDLINTKAFGATEQDAMNSLCADKILAISPKYNKSNWTEVPFEIKIRHFAHEDNWREDPLVSKYKIIDWSRIFR